ncbi:hypothetical protein [Fimbriimonas ginsengisoli]|uniref:Uncharacterized protein n=1 Tax=Fimbriimonas ginsengisoli Gsoil 348 TaxID=661478 RepID=A0A068NUT4_FIMGI|nr:hypothetical protein [Fimbriimonas ginsengisoli]AIE87303.1 hypothetical protein OP10G_3935 [Fimbriimonas ginsengisoli Gsoil 348]
MPGQPIDEAIGDLLKSLNKGQYLLLCSAIQQLGGELRIDPAAFSRMLVAENPKMSVSASDGPIVLRLVG